MADRRLLTVGAAIAGLLGLGACTPQSAMHPGSRSVTAGSASWTSASVSQGPAFDPSDRSDGSDRSDLLGHWRQRAIELPHPGGAALLGRPHVSRHPTFDRVVLDLDGSIPSYHVGFARAYVPSESAPVPLAGSAVLALRFHYAGLAGPSGRLMGGEAGAVVGLPNLLEYRISAYEGFVDLGLGVTRRATFRVFELTTPGRLVIDVHH